MHFTTATPTPGRHTLPRRTFELLRDPAGKPVPLAGLLEHARPAYGTRRHSWNAAVTALLSWPAEARIVRELTAELEAGTAMVEPVAIDTRRGQRVRNGMHRIAAHILAGAPTILATTAARTATDDTEIVKVRATLTPVPGTAQAPSSFDDIDGFAGWDYLRSLRAGAVWATADHLSLISGVGEVAYYAPHAECDAVLAAMTERAATVGYTLEVVGVRLATLGAWSDDEDDLEHD